MSPAEIALDILQNITIIVVAGVLSGRIAQAMNLPDIIPLLVVGIVLGPAGIGILHVPTDSIMSQLSLIAGASFILFQGGMELTLKTLRNTLMTVIVLATVGVVITAAVAGLVAGAVWHLPVLVALLLGAVIASTDPATLIPVFSQVRVRAKCKQTVIAESALNDATGAILTFTLVDMVLGHGESLSVTHALRDLLQEAGIGFLVGLAIGYLLDAVTTGGRFHGRLLGSWLHLSPQLMLLGAISAYVMATRLHGSGFMAAFVAGLILEEMEHAPTLHFVEHLSALFRAFIFVILGSNVDFRVIGSNLGWSLVVVLVFIFIARPLTVFLCAWPDRRAQWTLPELLFICWVRETGVIPAALLGLLATRHLPHFDKIYSVTFLAILVTIVVQAGTTRWWAKRLGLVEG